MLLEFEKKINVQFKILGYWNRFKKSKKKIRI